MTYFLSPQVISTAEIAKQNSQKFINIHPITVTTYFPVPAQCDASPFYTADGSLIDSSAKRWCAVSQDLLEKYDYGDTITVYIGDPQYNGDYIIHDCMHPRVKNCVDILIGPGDNRKGGLWKGVLWK